MGAQEPVWATVGREPWAVLSLVCGFAALGWVGRIGPISAYYTAMLAYGASVYGIYLAVTPIPADLVSRWTGRSVFRGREIGYSALLSLPLVMLVGPGLIGLVHWVGQGPSVLPAALGLLPALSAVTCCVIALARRAQAVLALCGGAIGLVALLATVLTLVQGHA